jgi:hypothetical protein
VLALFALTAVTKFGGSDGSNPLKNQLHKAAETDEQAYKLKQSEDTFKL